MTRFVVDFVAFFVVTTLSTLPRDRVARLVRRRHDRKRWLRWAGGVSLAVAGIGWSSRDLQTACKQQRNEGCIDIGGVGSQVLLIGSFVAFALFSAYLLYND